MRNSGPEQSYNSRSREQRPSSRAPFDTSDLHNIPSTTKDDPPYKDWWVVTDPDYR